MSQLYAGFSRVNITPMLGIFVTGYFKPRFAEGILDELEALGIQEGDTVRMYGLSFDYYK